MNPHGDRVNSRKKIAFNTKPALTATESLIKQKCIKIWSLSRLLRRIEENVAQSKECPKYM